MTPPKQCTVPSCGTIASHPDAVTYLFVADGHLMNECRWCRRQKETEQKQAKAIGMNGKVYVALDLKIAHVSYPKFYQLSREVKKLIKEREYKDFPPAQIYVSDGYSLWRLSDFKYRTSSLPELAIGWEDFCKRVPQWSMIEFD